MRASSRDTPLAQAAVECRRQPANAPEALAALRQRARNEHAGAQTCSRPRSEMLQNCNDTLSSFLLRTMSLSTKLFPVPPKSRLSRAHPWPSLTSPHASLSLQCRAAVGRHMPCTRFCASAHGHQEQAGRARGQGGRERARTDSLHRRWHNCPGRAPRWRDAREGRRRGARGRLL